MQFTHIFYSMGLGFVTLNLGLSTNMLPYMFVVDSFQLHHTKLIRLIFITLLNNGHEFMGLETDCYLVFGFCHVLKMLLLIYVS